MAKSAVYFLLFLMTAATPSLLVESSGDTNHAYLPCSDAKVQISDGFTFGIAFALRQSFVFNNSLQLSPCDRRLSLSNANSRLALFRPKVDEISLLTINTSSFTPVSHPLLFYICLIVYLKYSITIISGIIGSEDPWIRINVIFKFTLIFMVQFCVFLLHKSKMR